MTLIRPPVTPFKSVSACSPFSQPTETLSPGCQMGKLAFGQASALPNTPTQSWTSKSKQTFLPPTLPLYWLLCGKHLNPLYVSFWCQCEAVLSRYLAPGGFPQSRAAAMMACPEGFEEPMLPDRWFGTLPSSC